MIDEEPACVQQEIGCVQGHNTKGESLEGQSDGAGETCEVAEALVHERSEQIWQAEEEVWRGRR